MIENRCWNFRVTCETEYGEAVYITGSCPSLGCWDPQKIVPLTVENSYKKLPQCSEATWSANVMISSNEVEYRIVIAQALKCSTGFIKCIKRWETALHPRVIPAQDGESEGQSGEVLRFGYIGNLYKVDEGWLVNDSALFIRLCPPGANTKPPFVLWKNKYKDKKCFLKLSPIDISKSSKVDSFLDFHNDDSTTEADLTELRADSQFLSSVKVSTLKDGQAEFRSQEQFGVEIDEQNLAVFRCRLAPSFPIIPVDEKNFPRHFEHIRGFLADFYIETNEGQFPKFIGCCILLSSAFEDTYGTVKMPITSPKHLPVGQLNVSYMVVNAIQDSKCDFEVSYARYWKDSWKGLEVGHRGAGNSFHSQPKNCANIRENTIASLTHAFENGADMVEFDVQLSKDFIPLIYHDFHAMISLKQKKDLSKNNLLEIPIKDLTHEQLQALKIYHKTEKGLSRFSDEDWEDHQPFPSLERVLESVPLACGFNIEIKWTMRLHNGTYELEHPFELNRFLDRILKVVLEHKSPRKIIFSCFHPDICTIIRLKQHLYPVLFLTQGRCTQWPKYEDVRTRTIESAVLYAVSANILGINVNSDDLIRDPTQLDIAQSNSMVVFCWGDANSDSNTIESLKDLGLHGIIYDKIDVYNTKKSKKRDNVFLCDDKETCRCFKSSCRTKSTSPGASPSISPVNDSASPGTPENGSESPDSASPGSPENDLESPDTPENGLESLDIVSDSSGSSESKNGSTFSEIPENGSGFSLNEFQSKGTPDLRAGASSTANKLSLVGKTFEGNKKEHSVINKKEIIGDIYGGSTSRIYEVSTSSAKHTNIVGYVGSDGEKTPGVGNLKYRPQHMTNALENNPENGKNSPEISENYSESIQNRTQSKNNKRNIVETEIAEKSPKKMKDSQKMDSQAKASVKNTSVKRTGVVWQEDGENCSIEVFSKHDSGPKKGAISPTSFNGILEWDEVTE